MYAHPFTKLVLFGGGVGYFFGSLKMCPTHMNVYQIIEFYTHGKPF